MKVRVRSAVLSLVAVGALSLPVSAGAAPKLRQCKFIADPTPSLAYGKGAVSCKTAVKVVHAVLRKQTGASSFSVRVGGRKWACRPKSGIVMFECRRPGSWVSLRQG